MNRVLLSGVAATALLASGAALAAEVKVDIKQVHENFQGAGNFLNVLHNNTDVTQTATNLANGVISDDEAYADFDDIKQTFDSVQGALNIAVTEYGQWNDLAQEATSVANIVTADDVDEVFQKASGLQFSGNYAEYGQWVDGASQTASNIANLVEVDEADELVQFSSAIQLSGNVLHYDGYASDSVDGKVDDLTQSATNVANLINADDVNDIYQSAFVAQAGINYAEFGGHIVDTPDTNGVTEAAEASTQSATNVANLAQLGELDYSLSQSAYGPGQLAANILVAKVGVPNHYQNGSIQDVAQTASNLQNVLIAENIRGGAYGYDVVQTSFAPQLAVNAAFGSGFVNNLTQGATNVSNLVSVTVE